MDSVVQNQYKPDYVSPPGETILEMITELGMSQAELAQRTGRTRKTINEIIQGKAPITPETALQLERALNIPARFWNTRESHYRHHLATKKEREYLLDHVDRLKNFPVRDMIKQGWIQAFDDEVEQLRELLRFFGIASPEQWKLMWADSSVAYRRSAAFQSEPGAVSAWLRQGEIEAQDIRCQPYSPETFRRALDAARSLTLEPAQVFQPKLIDLCAASGVAVTFVPELPKTRVSGATRWLTSDKALIQLSLRYRTDDHLWFTFFHEAGHILLHGKRDIFLEGDDAIDLKVAREEEEASKFAADILIPQNALDAFVAGSKPGRISKQAIRDFAAKINIAPGIVVGQLQHDGFLPYTHCNGLKRKFAWAE
jgi:HTH-type transcriptional regulator/antitoxin HigA